MRKGLIILRQVPSSASSVPMASRSKVSIKTPETATCVEFSPYKDSSELLAIGCKSRVIVKAWPMRVKNATNCA